jgi:lipopolysaccharide O-acetyltransferase
MTEEMRQIGHTRRSTLRRYVAASWRLIWGLYWRRKFYSFGARSSITRPAFICGHKNIAIGERVAIWRDARIEALCPDSRAVRVQIGDGTAIQPYAHIGAAELVQIGRGVLIASHVYITDHDHDFSDPTEPPISNPHVVVSPVRIGDYVWLGERVMVLKGVTIGEHSVIGAGSVVTKSVPPFSVAVGVPARVIRRFDSVRKEWTAVG